MVKVVGVRFKKYFDPGDLEINLHENVIVEKGELSSVRLWCRTPRSVRRK